jgi:SAM-dependent methyltransferase
MFVLGGIMKRTLREIACNLDTDKTQSNTYIDNFERHFGHLRDNPVKMLEIGVFRGGSLLMWNEYFLEGLVVGIDINPNPLLEMPDRVRFYKGSQDDGAFLDQVSQECAPDGFDIIVDDASHIGTLTRASFYNLFVKHLKPGGTYVIEDWGTGYWDTWRDGRAYKTVYKEDVYKTLPQRILNRLIRSTKPLLSTDSDFATHNFGMVGFVKELVDEIAWPDIISQNNKLPRRASMIREMTLYCGHAFIVRV